MYSTLSGSFNLCFGLYSFAKLSSFYNLWGMFSTTIDESISQHTQPSLPILLKYSTILHSKDPSPSLKMMNH